MIAVCRVMSFTVAFFQIAAVFTGLDDWLALPWPLAAPAAVMLAIVPLLGTVLGIVAAVSVWHWSLVGALALFFPGFILAGWVIDECHERRANGPRGTLPRFGLRIRYTGRYAN